jgi:RNA polymerase-interacting CarD/CdnL/TRCF family regulator
LQFQVGDQVVDPVDGVGTVKSITPQRFVGEKFLPYYEVVTGGPTVWVPVDAQALRRITSKAGLAKCRRVLCSAPVPLDKNRQMRQVEIARRLKGGLLPARCALVRDLSAQSWSRPLGAIEGDLLKRISKAVFEEWAASEGVPVQTAVREIEGLLQRARLAWGPDEGDRVPGR